MYCGKQLEEGQQYNCLEVSGRAENPVTENRIVNERGNINQMNPFWGISFFAFSWVAGLIFMIPSILGCMRESEDKGIYIITAVTILCLIILGMLYKIGVPIYVPSELKDGVGGVSDVLKYFW